MRSPFLCTCVAAAAALSWSGSAALAGFTYLEDVRAAEALAAAGEFGPVEGDSDVIAAPEFQRQSQLDADASFDIPGDDVPQSAAASQTSRLVAAPGSDEVLLLASGNLTTAAGSGFARASTRVNVSFEVDETTAFSLDALATFTQRNASDEDRGRLTLKQLVDGSADGETLTTFALTIDDLTDNDGLGFNASGELTPGRYSILFDLFARASSGDGADLGSYSLAFDPAARLDGGNGNPIPLPPAAWAGLGTFACYGVSRMVRRARHA